MSGLSFLLKTKLLIVAVMVYGSDRATKRGTEPMKIGCLFSTTRHGTTDLVQRVLGRGLAQRLVLSPLGDGDPHHQHEVR